jgi:hypothetical protein
MNADSQAARNVLAIGMVALNLGSNAAARLPAPSGKVKLGDGPVPVRTPFDPRTVQNPVCSFDELGANELGVHSHEEALESSHRTGNVVLVLTTLKGFRMSWEMLSCGGWGCPPDSQPSKDSG